MPASGVADLGTVWCSSRLVSFLSGFVGLFLSRFGCSLTVWLFKTNRFLRLVVWQGVQLVRFVWCGILPLLGGGAVQWERYEAPLTEAPGKLCCVLVSETPENVLSGCCWR